MRLKHHRLTRPFVLAATAAMIATMLALAFGAEVGLAADYQDAKGNVCEGTFYSGSCAWGSHVTGGGNVALGDRMMPFLTSGSGNVALALHALYQDTTGSDNIASGSFALYSNTEGNNNVASGVEALIGNTTGSNNLASGRSALRENKTGHDNIASGLEALDQNTTGYNNLASGSFGLFSNTSGINNVASGANALYSNTEGSSNIASGTVALYHNITGNDNVASGTNALFNDTGSANVAIGSGAGGSLTTGSNNIDLANGGVAAESGTTRIGTEGTQTRAFVAGVHNSNVTGCSVQVTSEGQLGCNNNQAGSAVATYKSTKKVLTGKCLNFGGANVPGMGACPAAASGYSASKVLSSPMPANGATVSNLAANTSATVSGSDTAVVEVIDNTTSVTLLTCTVNSTNKNNCTNSATTGSAAARDKLEVRITLAGASGNEQFWEVTFRY
jgi:trimeric autotransporter adhesin